MPALITAFNNALLNTNHVTESNVDREGSSLSDKKICVKGIPAFAQKSHHMEKEKSKEYIQLFDCETEALLASFDAEYLNVLRIALCAALASDLLAPASIDRLAVVGTGKRVEAYLKTFSALRQVRNILVFDHNPFASGRFCAEMSRQMDAKFVAAGNLTEVLFEADVAVLNVETREPFLFQEMLDATYLCSLLENQLGQEFSEALWLTSEVICSESTRQQNVLSSGKKIDFIHTDLTSRLLDKNPNKSANSIKVYLTMRAERQDLLVAWQLYQQYLAKKN